MTSNSPFVSPRQIASWYLPELRKEGEPPISIPKLQRGLVWKPAQVELLWDSLFRGFPVGSLVVSNAVESQQLDDRETAELHLLDGQQRSNAIATGFTDPDFANPKEAREPILWIDLSNKLIPRNSTRQFLFRLTKQAHPWGYTEHDNCGRLSAHAIRESIQYFEKSAETRPTPAQILPYRAELPVPLAWVIELAQNQNLEPTELIRELSVRFQKEAPWLNLHDTFEKAIQNDELIEHTRTIIEGCQLVLTSKIVLIHAPDELIKGSDKSQEKDLANLELLFQRLNTQGTPLTGEELIYSMIKAYFPEVTNTIDLIRENGHLRTPASRMVTLAIRAALTKKQADSLHNGYDLRRLRSVMRNPDSAPEEYKAIRDFCLDESKLPVYCSIVEDWLKQNSETSAKLPPFLLVNLASGSSIIYLLLIKWAEYHHRSILGAEFTSILPGLATYIRWFAFKPDKCCNALFAFNGINPSLKKTKEAIAHCIEQEWLIKLQAPEDYSDFIGYFDSPKMSADEFKSWNWWDGCIQRGEQDNALEREQNWHHFHCKVTRNLEMLIFGQSAFFYKTFGNYDQSDGDYWEDHNRPWDYDHLLAKHCIVGRHSNKTPFKKVSAQWINTIGNFWACPFGDNRSYRDGDLSVKESGNFNRDALLAETTKIGFSHGRRTAESEATARQFCSAAKDRMIRIYTIWYSTASDLLT